MRPDEKYTVGAFANYEANDSFMLYFKVSFMRNKTHIQVS